MRRTFKPRGGIYGKAATGSAKLASPINRTARKMMATGTQLNASAIEDPVLVSAMNFSKAGISGHELVKRVVASTDASIDFVTQRLQQIGLFVPSGLKKTTR